MFAPRQAHGWSTATLDPVLAATSYTVEEVTDYATFLSGRGSRFTKAPRDLVVAWLERLSGEGISASSAARKLSAVRQFHKFLCADQIPFFAQEAEQCLIKAACERVVRSVDGCFNWSLWRMVYRLHSAISVLSSP